MPEKPGPDPTVTDERFLEILRNDYRPALGTGDIVSRVGLSQQAVSKRLKQLEDDGYVGTHKAGRARIWWITDAGKRFLDDVQSSTQ